MSDVRYQRTQVGRTLVRALVIAAVVEAVTGYWSDERWISIGVGALLLVLAGMFSTLTVRLSRDAVEWWFTFRPIGGRIRLDDLSSVGTRRYNPWLGLGLHSWNFRDWAYTVSGRDAIVLTRRDGRRTMLSTDDPAGAARAINAALDERRAGAAQRTS